MMKIFRLILVACSVVILFGVQSRSEEPGKPPEKGEDRLIAIDVLLEPDAIMVEKAKVVNARLREDYPQGYPLDATHAPHISLLHRYIRAKDLDAVEAAVDAVLKAERPTDWQLKATGYQYSVWNGTAITLMIVDRSPELMQLQQKIATAVEPFTATGGTSDAFVTSPDSAEINQQTIDWVTNFVPNASGEKYNPHVTVGVAKEDFVKKLKAENFEPFTFKASDVAIYQLGNFGTARKKLWTWKPPEH